MSGTRFLRRDDADTAAGAEVALNKRAARQRVFEANLALQLEKTLGGDASRSDIEKMTRAFGVAYQKMAHTVDARTSVRLGIRRYFVLQAGWAPKTGDHRLDSLDPFASKLLSLLPADIAAQMEPQIKAIGAALARTEISRCHPTDWRLRLNTPWVRLYLNFLSGKDKRDYSARVTHNRRKPVNERIGLFVLMAVVGALSLLGIGLIASTLWALSELMMTQTGRDTLAAFFDSSMLSLSAFIASLCWLVGSC